jgi:hypothetical protein
MMKRTALRTLLSGTVAAAALVAITIGGTAQAADGGGLRNCVDVAAKQANQVGCYERVWAGGLEYRMTFSNVKFSGSTPQGLDAFYVLAAQTGSPQGAPPKTFSHDHVVRDLPAHNQGTYTVKLQGFFVLCSGQGIASGACVLTWTAPDGVNQLPFATTVHGHPLTSTAAIESAAAAGDVVLVNLGPGGVIVGSISEAH